MATSGPEEEDELFEEMRTKFLEGPPVRSVFVSFSSY